MGRATGDNPGGRAGGGTPGAHAREPTIPAGVWGRSVVAGAEMGEGALRGDAPARRFRAVDPRTGADLDPVFICAEAGWVDAAARAAGAASGDFAALPGSERAALLEVIAAELEGVRRTLLERCAAETGLTEARLERELARTTSTLRAFARLAEDGSWTRAAVDHPTPGAEPGTIPAHDLRRILVPLGPIGVFGASNFPLAYGVAGGDAASALAAGCPVIVKGHPSHPGTGELAARAAARAVERLGLDAGVFSYLHSGGAHELEVGAALVAHPCVRGVGFTGSPAGGMALADAARRRAEPIPVFAEMGSTNPVFLLPAAVEEEGEKLAERLAGSILESSGQQCTCPGLLFLNADGAGARELVETLAARLEAARENVMLSRRVRDSYARRVRECLTVPGVACTPSLRAFAGAAPAAAGQVMAPAGMLTATPGVFGGAPTLRDEIFGPGVLVVQCAGVEEVMDAIGTVAGSLTGSVFASGRDLALARRLLPLLAARAGRVVFNGVPTGVRVAPAMVHAGPFPATNRPEATAVGAFAIERWTRPVCYQNLPEPLLPVALRDANPAGVRRLEDGKWSGA